MAVRWFYVVAKTLHRAWVGKGVSRENALAHCAAFPEALPGVAVLRLVCGWLAAGRWVRGWRRTGLLVRLVAVSAESRLPDVPERDGDGLRGAAAL